MKAIVQHDYGSTAAVFHAAELDKPTPKDDEVLVQVHAAGLHAGDALIMKGKPYIARFMAGWPKPKNYIPGKDVAGVVEAVGDGVTQLQPSDEVYGEVGSSCAEYVCVKEELLVSKPSNLSFKEAAVIPLSATTALQGLRDAAKVQPGQKVLINGASGGVGIYAVQIAKVLGAEVTGVCSTRNMEMVRSLGADHVIDYTQADFCDSEKRYDLILDNVGNRSFSEIKRVLKSQGKVLPNTGSQGIGYILSAATRSVFVRQQAGPFLATPNQEDLNTLKGYIEDGKMRTVIDRHYPLSDTPEALRYVSEGHVRGKVVITVV